MATVAPDIGDSGLVPAGDAEAVAGKSPRQLFWERFRQDKAAITSAVFIVLLALLAAFAGVISSKAIGHGPKDVFTIEMTDEFGIPKGPNGDFLFGADAQGRDLFVRLIHGARTSLLVAVVGTGLSIIVGLVFGIVAGYFGRVADTIISRLIDVMLAIPSLLFALGIAAACGTSKEGCLDGAIEPGKTLVIFIIVLFGWPYVARLVRGQVLSLREKEFVDAARSIGAGNRRIMFNEILPNLVAPTLIYATLLVPANIVFESVLTFLGVGIPVTEPSWGGPLSDAAKLFQDAWWLMVFPGVFLLATTLAFNLLGDGVRDALDPRSNR